MYEYKLQPKFSIGQQAACAVTKRIGDIIRVWVKPLKKDECNYEFKVSYTVKPDSGNQFKVLEENILEVASDEDGNEIILPKGVS